MRSRRLGLAIIALLTAVVAAAASAPRPGQGDRGAAPAQLMAFGSRSAAQLASPNAMKMDSVLSDLVRHAGRVRSGHTLEDLHSLSPAARFAIGGTGSPMVAIDAVTGDNPQQLKAALVGLGLTHAAVFANDVGGWLPISALEAASQRAELLSIRAAMPHTRGVATQGDFAQLSAGARSTYPALSGAGVMVGVLSDSYDCYHVYAQPGSGVPAKGQGGYASQNGFTADAESDVANGVLPAGVSVLEEAPCLMYGQPQQLPFADEGRAMLQILHVVAPGAKLAFYTADVSEADFASGIKALAAAGAKVVADDVGYFDEPFFQDGIVAQAIDAVEGQGVAYFSAAGNDSNLAYDIDSPGISFTTAFTDAGVQEKLLNFDSSQATNTTALPVTIAPLVPGEFLAVIVEWDQPYVTGAPGSGGATSQIDLCVSGAGSLTVVNLDGTPITCTGPNKLGTDPVQVIIIGNPANVAGDANSGATNVTFTVGLVNGTTVPGHIKLVVADDGAGSTINKFATNSATLQGHPGAAGAAAVGAAFSAQTPFCGFTPAILESYSSQGGAPIYFDVTGARLGAPLIRQKPDFVGPDGVNTTFFGFLLGAGQDPSPIPQCANDSHLPSYFGTSAAAPHAAGAAALMLQANPAITPTQIYDSLTNTAAPMSGTTPNFDSGFGFIQVQTAINTLPVGPPLLTLSDSTISVGGAATLAWSDPNANSCTGSWTAGNVALGGTLAIRPTATGPESFTFTCTSAGGSAMVSVTLQVAAALAITSTSLPSGQAGTAYSATLSATGGVPPYTWSIIGGTLPGGLTLNAATGAITGTPTTSASGAITFQVADAEIPVAVTQMASLALSIAAAPASSGGGHGGGALDSVTLLALVSLLLARLLFYSGITSANTNPSRSTISPTRTAMGAENIGPADTTV